MRIAELLIAWEAVAQYVENCDEDDPKLPDAESLLRRMDEAFVRGASLSTKPDLFAEEPA